eukprot:scaffold8875_cov31-Tisochrysis_lutea.AAC.1
MHAISQCMLLTRVFERQVKVAGDRRQASVATSGCFVVLWSQAVEVWPSKTKQKQNDVPVHSGRRSSARVEREREERESGKRGGWESRIPLREM